MVEEEVEEVEEVEETPVNKRIKSWLDNIQRWFSGTKKEILKIRVKTRTAEFWVCNSKKIQEYRVLAERQGGMLLGNKSNMIYPGIIIKKVVYK